MYEPPTQRRYQRLTHRFAFVTTTMHSIFTAHSGAVLSAGSFPEQWLVIKPTTAIASLDIIICSCESSASDPDHACTYIDPFNSQPSTWVVWLIVRCNKSIITLLRYNRSIIYCPQWNTFFIKKLWGSLISHMTHFVLNNISIEIGQPLRIHYIDVRGGVTISV